LVVARTTQRSTFSSATHDAVLSDPANNNTNPRHHPFVITALTGRSEEEAVHHVVDRALYLGSLTALLAILAIHLVVLPAVPLMQVRRTMTLMILTIQPRTTTTTTMLRRQLLPTRREMLWREKPKLILVVLRPFLDETVVDGSPSSPNVS
jgi:hypothetical protein